eukprot:m.212571 g.212571  ORF g.212571 m.212571 type:complete len:742 (-) comp10141_c6_seq29:4119-6344(-)
MLVFVVLAAWAAVAAGQTVRTVNGSLLLGVQGATLTLSSDTGSGPATGPSALVTQADMTAALGLSQSSTQAQINNAVLLLNVTAAKVDAQTTAIANANTRALLAEAALNTSALLAQTSLAASVQAEAGRALLAEAAMNASLMAETIRAMSVSSSLALALATETIRASNVESNLTARLAAAEASMAFMSLSLTSVLATASSLSSQLAAITACTSRGLLPGLSGNCTAPSGTSSSSSSSAQCPTTNISSTSITAVCQPGFSPTSSSTPSCAAGGSFPVTFTCSAVACPPNSNGVNVPSGCTCNAGYNGTITATTVAPAYYRGSCAPVQCPVNSVGASVPAGCTCAAGYNGSVVGTTDAPFSLSTCTAVPCPAFSAGPSVVAGCVCNAGYAGAPTPAAVSPFYTNGCAPVACPSNTSGANLPAGCACAAGFAGGVSAAIGAPYFSGSCNPVPCPAGMLGGTVPQGCTCNMTRGNYGVPFTATTAPPYYAGTCYSFSSCAALLTQSSVPGVGSTSGVYYLTYAPDVVYPVYCDQTTNSGGWELVLKVASTGVTFSYTAAAWTATSPINALSLDETNADALFPQYYAANYSQIMSKFKFNSITWAWPATSINPAAAGTYYKTASSFFNQPSYSFISNPLSAGVYNSLSYWTVSNNLGGYSNTWSFESACSGCGNGYHNFGINICCGISCARWGFIQNDQADCNSNDVAGGIGLQYNGNQYSCMDYYGCCGTAGVNAGIQALVYARR